jgi:hypothetical protein
VRNYDLFSNHWLEERLKLEPEWSEAREQSRQALERLADLWRRERGRVASYSEAGLEQAFIQPVLSELGWALVYQTHLRGRRPDYALFLSEEQKDRALRTTRTSPDFWGPAELVGDAKSWLTSLDRPSRRETGREYPPEQIEWYVTQSGCQYGLLTNGRLWRLSPRQLAHFQSRFETYLECDLEAILDTWTGGGTQEGSLGPLAQQVAALDDFHVFYLLFGRAGFTSDERRTSLVTRSLQGSSLYRLNVGEGLKDRVFEAVRLCIEGFMRHAPNELDARQDLQLCREQSFVFLYRLLFVMYGEDRDLLPLRTNRMYRENRSLSRLRDEIAYAIDQSIVQTTYPPAGITLWEDLQGLFDIIDKGARRYSVPAYNGGLFDAASHPFLGSKMLPNRYLTAVIDQLGRAPDPGHHGAGAFRVDYRDLSIQHLGHIYEGLLELTPNVAPEPLSVVRKTGPGETVEKLIPDSERVPTGFARTGVRYSAGEVYLISHRGERRATGSFYTPEHIVDYIISQTVAPLCAVAGARIRAEVEELARAVGQANDEQRLELSDQLGLLQRDYQNRLLDLKILDPAMGSGHFLLRVCQYLAEEIATGQYTDDSLTEALGNDESVLTFWKRKVAERCLFGVDKNPLAVELAKVALWLETSSSSQPLTFIDHHLRRGDSLVGGWIHELGALPHSGDLPPLLGTAESRPLAALVEGFQHIAEIPSDTAEQIKEKETILERDIEAIRRPLEAVADLWCSFHFTDAERVSDTNYRNALRAIAAGRRVDRFWSAPWYVNAMYEARSNGLDCFHWELGFPEVFLRPGSTLRDQGFDVVLGNPPYDVLSDRETGRDLTYLRAFLKAQATYVPSFRGKNNLYKLFICQGLRLLRQNGRLGFIVPMAVLGDDQAMGIRQQVVKTGAFCSVDAFPQKDDPLKRVFREAKLSTAIIVAEQSDSLSDQTRSFVSRVHPADRVAEDSPSVRLSRDDIALYDPDNLTIVSCDQIDWDLAVRLMASGRMIRLRDAARSHQGEVNETNDRQAGRISYDAADGAEVMRGANICLYCLRSASQGTPVYLRKDRFLERTSGGDKIHHHRESRVGFQRKSPQNNYRRLIATLVPQGTFLLESVSYVPQSETKVPLAVVLALLNSKLADWYFRLGSSNAMIGAYQVENLPFPRFAEEESEWTRIAVASVREAISVGDPDSIADELAPAITSPPFDLAASAALAMLAERISTIEAARAHVSRTERSALSTEAQRYQDVIDALLFAMVGFSKAEISGLEQRLAHML